MGSFLDHYNAEMAKRQGASNAPAASGVSLSSLPGPKSDAQKAGEQALGVGKWLLDMLDRPRNAMANTIYKGLEQQKTVADAVQKDGLGGLFSGNPLGAGAAFWEGLTSNDPQNKHSTSDIIEHGTDLVGSYDPNYVDTANNVDPVTKGIAGFIGDVALDPLTYIPATWGPKLFGGAAKLADKGLSAISEGIAGAPKLTEAAKTAVAAADGERAASKMVTEVADDAAKAPHVDFTDTDLADAMLHSTPAPRPDAPLSAVEPSPGTSFFKTVESKSPVQTQKGFETPVLEGLLKPAQDLKAEPLKFPGGAGKISQEEAVQRIAAESPARSPIQDFLANLGKAKEGVPGADVPSTMNEWARAIPDAQQVPNPTPTLPSKSMAEIRQLQVQYGQAMQKVAAGDQQAKAVAANIGAQVKPYVQTLQRQYTEASKVVATPDTTFGAFQAMVAHDYNNVENTLGPELTQFLSRNHGPEKFDQLVQAVKGVTDAGPDTADILRTTDQNLSKVLSDRLGVPRLQKPSSVDEVAQRTDELFSSADDYQKGVSDTVISVLRSQMEKGDWPFEITKDGLKVHRTTLAPGKGLGKYADQFNTFTQRTIKTKLDTQIKKASELIQRARGSRAMSFDGSFSKARTMQYKDALLRSLDDVSRNLDSLGVSLSIGHGAETSMLSLSELYRTFLSTASERGTQDLADLALFNYGTSVLDTHLMEATNNAIRGASRDEVYALLTSNKKIGAKGNLLSEATPNNLSSPKGSWTYTSKQAAQNAADKFGGKVVKQGKAWAVDYQGRIADELTDLIMESAPVLKVRAAENLAAYTAKSAAETHELATAAVKGIDRAIASPSVVGTTKVLGGTDRAIAESAAQIAATPDALSASQLLAQASMDRATQVDLAALRRALPASSAATSVKDLKIVADDIGNSVDREVSQALKTEGSYHQPGETPDPDFPSVQDSPSGVREAMSPTEALADAFNEAGKAASKKVQTKSPAVNLSEDPEKFIDAFGRRIQDPYGKLKWKTQEWFNQNFKAAQVHPLFAGWQNRVSERVSYTKSQLNAIHAAAVKAGDKDGKLLQSAFANVQRGLTSSNPASAEIETMIRGVLGDFFDLNATGAMANSFLRIGQVDAVNAMLAQKGLNPEKYFFDAAKATEGKTLNPDALADQWKEWDVTDPLDLMHRMNLSREELAINSGVARSFMQLAKDNGAWSSTPQKGFVEIKASGKSRFGAFIPEGTFVKKELAEELQQVESVLRTSREFQGELGDFVRNVYAPVLNAWKRSITIMRPGHHVRNYIGSTSATWVRRGSKEFRRSHQDAFKILMQRGDYDGTDMLSSMAFNGLESIPQRADVLLSMGKRGDLTVDEAYRYMQAHGAMPGFRVHEDFLESEGALNALMHKVTLADTKVGKAAGTVSEYVDHFTRAQHFMQALRQDAKRYPRKSKDQLMKSALDESLKYHPDATMLTPFEAKLRLAVPFYTWFSKMMPALVESLVMHPARVTAPVKASYDLAVAMGLNPASITDPFPEDQLFPSFIKSNPMGPQMMLGGAYLRANPGFAHLDVLNTFGDDPFRGLLGMTSPLLRVPVELATGGSMSTGGRIKDTSDYIDQSIPGINYLSNISGFSPTGSVGTLLSGQGLDPQHGFQPKADGSMDKSGLDQGLSAFNWLTGLGVQNLSRPSYVSYAEIQKRNQAGASNGQ